MSSRLIIALIIMLLAPGVQAHNFVTGKTVTPVYIQEGGELLLNSDDEIASTKSGTAHSWREKSALFSISPGVSRRRKRTHC